MITLPSASALGRAMACALSVLGRQIQAAPTVWSRKGDTFHDFARAVGVGGDPQAACDRIAPDDPARALCTSFPIAHIPQGGSFEVAFAWHVRTGKARVLGEGIGRAYEAAGADRQNEFVGSADWAGVANGCATVIDWKTGWQMGRVADSWQLKFLAFCVAELNGLSEAAIAYVIPREDQAPEWRLERLDALALAEIQAELRALHKRLTIPALDPLPDPVEGDHCRYCPAYQHCPAKTALVRGLAEAVMDPGVAYDLGALAPAEAAQAVKMLRSYDEISKRLWAQLKEYAREYPLDLGNGKRYEWAPGRSEDRVVDAAAALDFLATEYGVAVARAAAQTTKGAIEEAAKAYARSHKLPVAQTASATIDRLRQIKAIEKKPGRLDARIVNGKLEAGE